MNKNDFLTKLAEILDCEDELTIDKSLEDVEEWDSLGIIGFLAEMESYCTSPIQAVDVKGAKTVGDLYALIK
jgi:Phosphopantetheine attachment site.